MPILRTCRVFRAPQWLQFSFARGLVVRGACKTSRLKRRAPAASGPVLRAPPHQDQGVLSWPRLKSTPSEAVSAVTAVLQKKGRVEIEGPGHELSHIIASVLKKRYPRTIPDAELVDESA